MSFFFNSKVDSDFDTPKLKVLKKLNESEKYKQAFDKDELSSLAEVLSNSTKLKGTYLTTKWKETLKVINEAPKNTIKKSLIPKFNSRTRSNEEIQDVDLKDLEEIDFVQDEVFEKDIKIKLIITELAETNFKKVGRQLVSPVLTMLNCAPKFGMFHSSLMIGPCNFIYFKHKG